MNQTVKAAIVQTGSQLFDTEATLDRMQDWVQRARDEAAGLIVFPEAFVGGYPKGHDFGARVGSRTAEGRDWFARYFESAIDVPGPACERMGEMARAANAWLVTGVIERAGGTLYCSGLTFAPDGRLANRRRKLMPTAMERLIWGFGDGSTLEATPTPFGPMSALICWENFMPLARSAFYAQQPVIHCAPTVDDRETWLSLMRTIALEGRCFVLSANHYFTRSQCPDDYHPVQGDDPSTVLINGGSCIISPLGDVLCEPVFGRDALVVAELDLADVARGKFDFDASGHYGRPDVFELQVNHAVQATVRTSSD
ncbi:MAG: carbon-nitrogen hydrolase family protein [Maricaulis sp.]|uniref:carbon-nitrogen hydrolase family protein n=1 Tax=Maricaulis sp. TaxID=1486257 RepID=UPI0026208CD7|nr:carbon-nitrogen hydrolase family protein [Maricaulis sp.]MDM7984250.1 carbon-nitrogen hydrolase family protein [Maricaulis sp.]